MYSLCPTATVCAQMLPPMSGGTCRRYSPILVAVSREGPDEWVVWFSAHQPLTTDLEMWRVISANAGDLDAAMRMIPANEVPVRTEQRYFTWKDPQDHPPLELNLAEDGGRRVYPSEYHASEEKYAATFGANLTTERQLCITCLHKVPLLAAVGEKITLVSGARLQAQAQHTFSLAAVLYPVQAHDRSAVTADLSRTKPHFAMVIVRRQTWSCQATPLAQLVEARKRKRAETEGTNSTA